MNSVERTSTAAQSKRAMGAVDVDVVVEVDVGEGKGEPMQSHAMRAGSGRWTGAS